MAKKKQGKAIQLWKNYKKASVVRKVVVVTGALAVVGFLMITLLVLSVRFGAFGKLPTHRQLQAVKNPESTQIYSSDEQVIGKFFTKNRTNISIDAISPYLTDALVATEDSRFYKHNGIDFRAWMRVLFKTVIMGDKGSGGGSTISQQLAKNLFPRKRHSMLSIPVNKIREFFVAKRLEKIYSKNQILSLYLNTVPFGGDIFGVQVAAKQLFGTDSQNIKQEDAAVLIGMLKANTKYHPAKNPKNALKRRSVVLGQLHKYGYISAAKRDSLAALPLVTDYKRESVSKGLATYFREQIRQEAVEILKENNLDEDYNLYTSGLKIYTTIDSRLQAYAEEAMKSHLSQLQRTYDEHWKGVTNITKADLQPFVERSRRYRNMKSAGASKKAIDEAFSKKRRMNIFDWEKGERSVEMSPMDSINYYVNLLNTGFLAADPKSGHVLAWVGGISHKHMQYDHVKSKRPVGSTFKPFVYANALNQGHQPCEYLYNRLVTYKEYDDWQPENADGEYSGVYSMEGGLTNSVNSISVNLITQYGIDETIALAHKMGVQSNIPEVPSIALGTAELPLYEMVNAYASLANHGVRPSLKYLLRIEDKNGKVLYSAEEKEVPEPVQALDSLTNQMVVHMMESVIDNGTGRRLRNTYGLTGDMAGKTGTTQNHSDGWFIGYTPDIVAGVWVGGASPKVRFRSLNLGAGGNMALPIWGKFMQKALKEKDFADWQNNAFPALPDSIASQMACDHYQDEMPVFANLEEQESDAEKSDLEKRLDSFFDVLFEENKNKKNTQTKNRKPQNSKQSRTRTSRSEEIRKNNEKLKKQRERKQKRKGFFKKIFGN